MRLARSLCRVLRPLAAASLLALAVPAGAQSLVAHWKLNESSGTTAADAIRPRLHGHGHRHVLVDVRHHQQRFFVQRFDQDSGHGPVG